MCSAYRTADHPAAMCLQAFALAYAHFNANRLDEVIEEHRATFEEDNNLGLVEQCRAKLFRQSIRRLTEV